MLESDEGTASGSGADDDVAVVGTGEEIATTDDGTVEGAAALIMTPEEHPVSDDVAGAGGNSPAPSAHDQSAGDIADSGCSDAAKPGAGNELVELPGADGRPVKVSAAALREIAARHVAPEMTALRGEYLNVLESGRRLLDQSMGPEPDWAKVMEDDPIEGPARYIAWQQAERRRAVLEKARDEEIARGRAEDRRRLEAHVADQRDKLRELIPEWTDPAVAKRDQAAIRAYLTEAGFTADEIAGTYDARAVALADKARRYDALMAGRAELDKRAAAAPPYTRPGTTGAGAGRTQSAALARFAASGDVADAAALIMS